MGRLTAVAAVLVVVVGCEKRSSRSPQPSAEQAAASASHDASVGSGPSRSDVQRIDVAEIAGELTSSRDIARLVPSLDGDVPNGFILYQVSELGQRFGIRDKDVLVAVNGLDLGMADRSLLVLQMVADDSRITLDIRRDGRPHRREYELIGGTFAELLGLEDFVRSPERPSTDGLDDVAMMYVQTDADGAYRVDYPLVSIVRNQLIVVLRELDPGDVAGGLTVTATPPPFEQLGVRTGDVIREVGDVVLSDRNRVLDAWYLLGSNDDLQLELTRAGKPVTLRYRIVGRP